MSSFERKPDKPREPIHWAIGSLLRNQTLLKYPVKNGLDNMQVHKTIVGVSSRVCAPFSHRATLLAMRNLAEAIQSRFSMYDLLVVDDISARLPGLVYRSLINKQHASQGLPPVATRFVNGRYPFGEPIGRLHLPERASFRNRTLILTESSNSGDSLRRLHSAIKDLRRGPIDLAAITATERAERALARTGSDCFTGKFDPRVDAAIYNEDNKLHIGVRKKFEEPYAMRQGSEDFDIAQVRQGRESVTLVADALHHLLTHGPTT